MMKTSLRDSATKEQKDKLRKIKTLSDSVKTIVYGGNKGGIGPTIQFNSDLKLYGLWEALLYVEGYESDGFYELGTALKAFNEAIKK